VTGWRTGLPSCARVAGLSQAALAEVLGTSRQTIISIERGRFDPSLPLAFKIAHHFETTIEEVFTPDP
jgi:putative transcriptional regulator